MEDKQIIDLYFKRSDTAIYETQIKYGKYCRYIAYNILQDNRDAEECENDTYVKVWSSIPPERPNCFSAFLGKITRNLALDLYRRRAARKRGAGQYEAIVEELSGCISTGESIEHIADEIVIKDALNHFLENLPHKMRIIFVRRYWYMSSIKEIAKDFSLSESNVKMTLLRTRNNLKAYLEKEGIDV